MSHVDRFDLHSVSQWCGGLDRAERRDAPWVPPPDRDRVPSTAAVEDPGFNDCSLVEDRPDNEFGSSVSIRLLLVDDHQMLRDGLRAVLALEDEIKVVGEAGDGHAAVKMAYFGLSSMARPPPLRNDAKTMSPFAPRKYALSRSERRLSAGVVFEWSLTLQPAPARRLGAW